MKRLHSILAGALLLSAPALVPCAVGQVSVAPAAVEVSLAEGQQAEVVLTVANEGVNTLALALSLAPAPSADDPPGEPGEVLFTSEQTASLPDEITMTPDGQVFVERGGGGARETLEFTAELEFVRAFEHPFFPVIGSFTGGITYNADTETLWWMDVINDCTGSMCTVEQALLIEGDFDGQATGRTLAVPWVEDATCGRNGVPSDAVYAEDTDRFFWIDIGNKNIWAMDTTGAVVEGYPVPMSDYAGVPQPYNPEGCLVVSGLDAHALGGEPVLEVVTGYPFVHPRNRQYTVVVLDRWGRNRGAETPLFDLPTPDGFGVVRWIADVVRSQLDPSVLYLTVTTGKGGASNRYWVYAVRAAPLPPEWLHASLILFSVEGESEREVTLVLDATGLEPGVYEGVAEVRLGDGIGPVEVEVPVALTVTPSTASEEGPGEAETALSVYPNPSAGDATVVLTLPDRADAHVALFDVLGREVAVLHEGPLATGLRRFELPTELPGGVYIVVVEAEGVRTARRVTLLR